WAGRRFGWIARGRRARPAGAGARSWQAGAPDAMADWPACGNTPACPHGRRESAGEGGKSLHHALVDGSLERDDEAGQFLRPLPAPFAEFRLVAVRRRQDVDLALLALEAEGEPF